MSVPLSVLDLVPISSGSTAAQAVRHSVDLARRAEEFGYARYWFAEHHLNPGVAGVSPAVTIALAATATTSIRLGAATDVAAPLVSPCGGRSGRRPSAYPPPRASGAATAAPE